MKHPGVDLGGKQIVGSRDGVDVTCQVQIKLVHGNHLRVSTAGRAPLDPESGSLGGLPDAGKSVLPQVGPQGLGQPYGCSALALSQGSRCDTRHDDISSILDIFEAIQGRERDFGLLLSKKVDLGVVQAHLLGHNLNVLGGLGPGDLDVSRNLL